MTSNYPFPLAQEWEPEKEREEVLEEEEKE